MRTTLGQLISELVDAYEHLYQDHELATVATSVTIEQVLHDNATRAAQESAPTHRMRRVR